MRNSVLLMFVTALPLVLGGCTGTGVYAKGYYSDRSGWASAPIASEPSSTALPSSHKVGQGETLYSIAFQYGHDYRQVAAWNGIKSPYTIYPGQTLSLQQGAKGREAGETTRTPLVAAANNNTAQETTNANDTHSEATNRVPNNLPISVADAVQWSWPTQGKLFRTYLNTDPGRRGIDVTGQYGQGVMAAASGQVVYSGSGLRGYGKLIIIKHNDTYFSAYAHNKTVYVKENETIKIGQRIADMGKDEGGQTYLHFEIRRNGVPVNPLSYLPKQRP